MSINIASVLPSARLLLNSTLPDSCVNSRTGETHNCRVDSTTRTRPVFRTTNGMASFIEVPDWAITLADGVDLKANDTLTVTRVADSSVQTYMIVVVFNPTSYSVSTDATAIATSLSTHGHLPFPPNGTVTFTHPANGLTLLADALLRPLDVDLILQGATPTYRWQVFFDPTLAYTNGELPGANHLISAPFPALGNDPDGVPFQTTITKPIRTMGIMPVAIATFDQMP